MLQSKGSAETEGLKQLSNTSQTEHAFFGCLYYLSTRNIEFKFLSAVHKSFLLLLNKILLAGDQHSEVFTQEAHAPNDTESKF